MSTPSPWKFFSIEELQCRHCHVMKMDDTFMKDISQLRLECGFPFTVTSGYRCSEYNMKESTTGANGPHTMGLAIDLGLFGTQAWTVVRKVMDMGCFTGLGVSQKQGTDPMTRFLHIDAVPITSDRVRPYIWSY